MKTIIFDPISEDSLAYAKSHLDVVHWDDVKDSDFEDAEAVIVRVYKMTPEVIDKMPNLKIIAKHGVGTDNIDKASAKMREITVTNTPLANANSVAEMIVALTLAVSRRIVQSHQAVLSGVDKSAPLQLQGFELRNRIVGLVGLGNIGKLAADIFQKAFNMKIIVFDPYVTDEECSELGFEKVNSLEELCKTADVISISVPLTKDTENMIAKRELQWMKPGTVLINTARGKIVNETDLLEALQENRLYGAATDAFAEEPVSQNNPLLQCDNFIATPHNGANTSDALTRMGYGAVDAILNFNNK